MNNLLSLCIGYFAVLIWTKVGTSTGFDYSVVMAAAAVPAFVIGWFSTNKMGRFVIAPAVSCVCILFPPWLEMRKPELAGGGDAGVLFFMILVLAPAYCLFYVGASMLGSFLRRVMSKGIVTRSAGGDAS